MAELRFFVEGDADIKFLTDYVQEIFNHKLDRINFINLEGYTNLRNKAKQEFIVNSDGINVVILDADSPQNNGGFDKRKREILQIRSDLGANFELFLFPDNQNDGDLETLLSSIIATGHRGIFRCWGDFEICLTRQNPVYTLPAEKSKIYTYMEVLHGTSKSEKEKCKEKNRNYRNTNHWDLHNPALSNLRAFLTSFF